jgi:phenylalanyl-tRNA synthetase beta chain
MADFGALRGIVERLLEGLHIADFTIEPLGERREEYPQFHPGRAALLRLSEDHPWGVLGELHPRLAEPLELRQRVYLFEVPLEALRSAAGQEARYQPASRYPVAQRDLAPRLARTTPYAAVEAAIRRAEAENMVAWRLTDVFQGAPLPEDVKSLTLSFTFRSAQGTLTEAEINTGMERIRESLERECAASFAG